jgi:hypothetical protein
MDSELAKSLRRALKAEEAWLADQGDREASDELFDAADAFLPWLKDSAHDIPDELWLLVSQRQRTAMLLIHLASVMQLALQVGDAPDDPDKYWQRRSVKQTDPRLVDGDDEAWDGSAEDSVP